MVDPRRRLVGLLALPLLFTVAPATAATTGSEPQPQRRPDFAVTAHRGAPGKALGENTLPAFGRALADGATAIETDLRRTKDDELVVLHDSGVGRTTNCSGPIGGWTLRDLTRKCRERTTRQPLLTADEILAWADQNDASLMLELKGSNWSIRQIRRLARTVKRSEAFDLVAVSSLRVGVLERVRRLAPNLDTQLIVAGWPKVRATLGRVDGYNVPAAALTRQRVKRLHRKDIRVVGGGADTPREWRRLRQLDVDGIVTPSVRRYRTWAR